METTKKTTVKKPAAAKKAETKTVKAAAPKRAGGAKKVAAAVGPKLVTEPSHEEISRRAYEIWMRHGGQHGSHGHDWELAEQELRRA